MATKFFKFFRAGVHRAMTGHVLEFTESDLEKTAVIYPSMPKKAPLVLGHPANDGPALGEVVSLKFHDGALYAEADVSDKLVNLVRSGEYKDRSAAFYSKEHPGNPYPGVWTLRHIGFLSIQKPAVKDLGPLQFAESSLDTVFSSAELMNVPMIDLGYTRQSVAFAEHDTGAAYALVRERMHAAINQLCARYPEFSYIEATRILESMMLKRG